jgi:hypothetical protein
VFVSNAPTVVEALKCQTIRVWDFLCFLGAWTVQKAYLHFEFSCKQFKACAHDIVQWSSPDDPVVGESMADSVSGFFILTPRYPAVPGVDPEWDEHFCSAKISDVRYLALTTTDVPPRDFVWAECSVVPGLFRVMQGTSPQWAPPLFPPVNAGEIFYVSQGNNLWGPSQQEVIQICTEGTALALRFQGQRQSALPGSPEPRPFVMVGFQPQGQGGVAPGPAVLGGVPPYLPTAPPGLPPAHVQQQPDRGNPLLQLGLQNAAPGDLARSILKLQSAMGDL